MPKKKKKKKAGLVRDSNPGPLAPKARIMPLDQQATVKRLSSYIVFIKGNPYGKALGFGHHVQRWESINTSRERNEVAPFGETRKYSSLEGMMKQSNHYSSLLTLRGPLSHI